MVASPLRGPVHRHRRYPPSLQRQAGNQPGGREGGTVITRGALAAGRFILTAFRAGRYLLAVRAALPWWLRALVVIGCIQIPVLPTDEVAAGLALIILWLRYRRLLKACWRAAQLDLSR